MTLTPLFVHFAHCSTSCLNRPSGQFAIPRVISSFHKLNKTNKRTKKTQVAFTWKPYSKQLSRCKVKLSQGIWVCLSVLDLTVWICSLNICCLNMPLSRCRALILNQLPPPSCQRLSFAEQVTEGLSDRWQSLQSPSASFSKQALKNGRLMPSHRAQGGRIRKCLSQRLR